MLRHCLMFFEMVDDTRQTSCQVTGNTPAFTYFFSKSVCMVETQLLQTQQEATIHCPV